MKRGIVGLTYAVTLVLLGFFLVPSLLMGQANPETFTATATAKAAGKSAAEPVKIVITKYIEDADRTAVGAVLKTGDIKAAVQALQKLPDLGTVEVLGKSTPIKYAYSRSMGPGAGRMVTVITAQPIHYVMAGQSGDKPKEDYPFGVALLILDAEEKGDGEIDPAARIKLDAQGAVVVDDYGVVKVWLKNVAKVK